ncbi:DNA polymerase/3'-5' exonuclease PolX [Desulfopila inferna]|uniref:DNA polymerase/3'-5' exonuclease PolX n=1 Tax=Desulfopila inferna TaxID=468528 RepID=UPI001966C69B|nr:DNA polymerase/3'-5' exonuclease PolX [Desulfopila inferna]MBM9606604.1 DNA polymerase/3'-5' exonuclease PolX [Desulfopila inferna]
MPIHNSEIANIFYDVAAFLEIDGANPFRIRAYRGAARTISSLSGSVVDRIAQGHDLTEIPGIGRDLAHKIEIIVETGSLPMLKELESRLPPGLKDIMRLSGVGPKKAAALYKELGIKNLEGLKKAAESGRIRELRNFGAKVEANILEEVNRGRKEGEGRSLLIKAEEYAEPLCRYLLKSKGVKKVVPAGSYRRRQETVGDLDILVTCKKGSNVMNDFTGYDDVRKVVSQGKTRSTVILRSGLQVDLRVVPEVSYGAALHYFTGSKPHNIAIRKIGLNKGYKINEYGVFKNDKRIAGRTEEEVYETVGLPYIEPELREDRGEIREAQQGTLPELIRIEDLQGDLHTHTDETDGRDTLEEMAQAAQERGYSYLAVTDHSQQVSVAKGLDEDRLLKQIDAIDRLNDSLKGLTLLKGIEVDILKDGSLDLPDRVLKRLDIRVCSVHSYFKLSAKEQTERILKAMDNPLFNVLGHPSGRLIQSREAYDLDMERIMEGAKERGCFLELNSQPDRMDLRDVHLKRAREIGVLISISTDAHWSKNLDWIRFGVGQARRGWLSSADVINTRSLTGLRKLLKR